MRRRSNSKLARPYICRLTRSSSVVRVRLVARCSPLVAHLRNTPATSHVQRHVHIKCGRAKSGPVPKARRWAVERTHAWLPRFRRLLVRWEKREDTYLGMLHFALGIITWFHAFLRNRLLLASAPPTGMMCADQS
nr:transposase [Archangium primigenium]